MVQYAHAYGVQVLVTLNTLLHEDEYPEAVALAHALYQKGVDALIIQDLHLLDFDLPPIRLHASTQCDNRTPEQVARLRDLGFKRVVLARELGIEEIRAIHEAVPDIELEAFVHGALCVSYSGRCYISEVLAGRSANRGACAQFCRMAYDLLDENMKEVSDEQGVPIHQRHLLSLQDLDRSAYLAELIEAGVTTFKIEGRLKDADYVTNITAYYREKLDNLSPVSPKTSLPSPLRGEAPSPWRVKGSARLDVQWTSIEPLGVRCEGRQEAVFTRSFTPNPEKTFHRGATDYFLHGRTRPMANWDTPKSTGEYIGEVLEARGNTLRVRLKEGVVLHNGDGLTIGSEGFSVNGVEGNMILVNKRFALSGENLRKGAATLYRNLDTEFVKSLHSERRIPVDILFRETENGFELTYTPVHPALSPLVGRVGEGLTFEPAKNEAKALETIRTQLAKLGDTPYIARNVQIESRPYFIPIRVLNEWRREVVESQKTKDRSLAATQSTMPLSALSERGLSALSDSGLSALSERGERSLMTCKYCLLFELGHCRKTNPYPKDKEPRYLRLRTGKLLRLTFDCKNCQMMVDET